MATKAPPELGGSARRDPAPGKSVTGSQAGDVAVAQAGKANTKGAGGKPSVAGHTAKGAAKGAAAGAELGSVIPGVGTAVGAGIGAVGGGALGAHKGRKEKRAWARANRGAGTQVLVAEFVICMIILALSPMTTAGKDIAAKDWMKRGTAVCALFMILGMVGAVGPKATRAMAAFGGLVTLTLLVNQRSIFVTIADKLKTTGTATDSTPPSDDAGDSTAAGVGGLGGSSGAGVLIR